MSSLSQVRPLRGRTARLLQGRHRCESVLQEQHCCHERAKPPQVAHQKNHHLDAGLPISTFQNIINRKQAEALYQGQFSGRPELQSLSESAHSLSCEDLKPKHLDQHTIWANPLSKTVLPQDGNREENKIVLHKLWNQEASEHAWRPEDRLGEVALPEWVPGSEVAWRQTVLLELQDSFSKTAAQKCFHDSINGETKTSEITLIREGDMNSMVSMLFISITDTFIGILKIVTNKEALQYNLPILLCCLWQKMEFIFFIVPCMVLCFGFVMRTVLTMCQCFSCFCVVFRQNQGHFCK